MMKFPAEPVCAGKIQGAKISKKGFIHLPTKNNNSQHYSLVKKVNYMGTHVFLVFLILFNRARRGRKYSQAQSQCWSRLLVWEDIAQHLQCPPPLAAVRNTVFPSTPHSCSLDPPPNSHPFLFLFFWDSLWWKCQSTFSNRHNPHRPPSSLKLAITHQHCLRKLMLSWFTIKGSLFSSSFATFHSYYGWDHFNPTW